MNYSIFKTIKRQQINVLSGEAWKIADIKIVVKKTKFSESVAFRHGYFLSILHLARTLNREYVEIFNIWEKILGVEGVWNHEVREACWDSRYYTVLFNSTLFCGSAIKLAYSWKFYYMKKARAWSLPPYQSVSQFNSFSPPERREMSKCVSDFSTIRVTESNCIVNVRLNVILRFAQSAFHSFCYKMSKGLSEWLQLVKVIHL